MVTRSKRRLSSSLVGRLRGGVRGPRRRFDRELVCDRCGCTYLSKRTSYQGRAFCSGAAARRHGGTGPRPRPPSPWLGFVRGLGHFPVGAQDLWRRDKFHFQKWAVEQADEFVTTKRMGDSIDEFTLPYHPHRTCRAW